MAAGQRLWASFVRSQASLSTPHLYVSSLATELAMSSAVDCSSLTRWRKVFPGLPSIECKGISQRGMLMIMKRHRTWVYSVAFSPDGTHVVSGSVDMTVRICDATTGAEVTRMEGHSDTVNSVAFSPDGAHVVSGSEDKSVRIWDATTGAEVTKMEGHSGLVESVAFSPDGAQVVSGSGDNSVRILQRLTRLPSQPLSHLWIIQMDGWVVLRGHPHIRLFWYPSELQPTVFVPHCLQLISNMGQTRLEFQARNLGPDWQRIYHSPPTYHLSRILFGILAYVRSRASFLWHYIRPLFLQFG